MTVDLETARAEELRALEVEFDALLDKEGGRVLMTETEMERLKELRKILERYRSELDLLF